MRKAAHLIFVLLITGAFGSSLSCTSPSPDAPPSSPAAAQPAPVQKQRPRVAAARLGKMIHDRINRERRKHGLPAMRWDGALERIAAAHSRDMAARNYFGHTSPEGHGYSYRYLENGYACGVTVDRVLRRGAENILRLSPGAGEDPAGEVVRAWMADKKDRGNLLSSPWEREGVGVCVGPDGVVYITLNFC